MRYVLLAVTIHLLKNTPVWKVKEVFADVSVPFVVLGFLGAILGKGPSRIPLALCCVLGFFVGAPIGVL